LDGIYPAGLAVATVTRIDQDPETPFAKIISTPAAKVNYHLQLLILGHLESKEAPSNKAIDNKGAKLNAKNT
jgi:rod shape-determining protein MreC